ncbi:MAG: polysaccharide biosynthesis tyrosine autokinase [Verrucomicrobia bacterium]|nr:polysaccharide biosynthesis tyrosine autokinase [Deltaproteobacteria bacterium]
MNQPQPSPPQNQIEEVHLSDYLNVIMRRRRIFLISFFALFVGVALYTFMMKPIYEAGATLHVKDEKGGKGGILGDLAMLNSSNPVDAEIEILKSRSNAEEVVKRLHLTWGITKKSSDLSFKIIEFASTSTEPEYTVELTGPDSFSVKAADGSPAVSGKTGQLIRTPNLTLLLSDVKGQPGDSFRLQQNNFNRTVEGLRKSIKASEVGKKTNIIKVTNTNTDPVLSRDVVNTLVQAYLDQTLSFKTEEASRTVTFVEDQLKGTRDELDQSEKNLQTYKSASGVVKLDTEAEELVKKLSEIEKDRASVNLQRKQVEFALTALQEARRKGQVYTPAVFKDDPLIGSMATRLTELEVQKRALVSENTESHPQVKAVQSQIDQLQKKLQSTYETSKLNLAKQETSIQQQLQQYEAKMRTLPVAERDLARLMRLSKVNADIYMFLLQKHEEARILKASTISNIKVVDPAITPDLPVKPQKKKNLLLGLLVGLMFAVGVAFFMDYLDDTIKDEEEAKRALAWPLLAMIPVIEVSGDGEQPPSRASQLVVLNKPKSQVAEAFRGLRTAIHFSSLKHDTKVVMITSSFPGEGKSTIAANLALTFAQAGKRVILVDCDLRRPSMNILFEHPRSPGLSEVLAGDIPLADALFSTDIENISLLTAGTIPPNPAELLGSDRMRDLLAGLREAYDMVIIDAPPVIPVTDAPLLTAFTDMVVVVLESGRIPAKAAQRMKELLQSVQAPVAGFVLNDRTALFSDTYGSYGKGYYGRGYYGRRYYGHAYYGADDQKETAPKKSWWRKLLK